MTLQLEHYCDVIYKLYDVKNNQSMRIKVEYVRESSKEAEGSQMGFNNKSNIPTDKPTKSNTSKTKQVSLSK